MRILLAKHLGMCFGVRDAIDLAIRQAEERPLTVLGDLVHNENVLAELRARGITIAQNAAEVRTEAVMVTAHGASDRAIRNARARGLELTEATCPLVHAAHAALKRLVRDGFHPVIIGKRAHVEVRGMTEDLEEFDVVLSDEDIEHLQPHRRFGVVAQTTQPIDKVVQLVEKLRCRFPESEIRFEDTVCRPTKQRQQAAVDLARRSNVVIVIGGRHSNNTQELVNTCRQFCERVYHVQTAADLKCDWFSDAESVGVTAGTSTPDAVISQVQEWLCAYASSRKEGALETTSQSSVIVEELKAA